MTYDRCDSEAMVLCVSSALVTICDPEGCDLYDVMGGCRGIKVDVVLLRGVIGSRVVLSFWVIGLE